MFPRCRLRGTPTTVDGKHLRTLCEDHARGIRQVLDMPEKFRVSWGMWTHEKIGRDEARISELRERYGDPPSEPTWNDATDFDRRQRTTAEGAWEAIEYLTAAIQEMRDDGDRPPIVSVEPRTGNP